MDDHAPPRCAWVSADPLYIAYHDHEWGRPLYDGQALFELLCLEGQQAGLSWLTVLKKRQRYRQAFHGFDPAKVAAMTAEDIADLLLDQGLIRNRRKLEAIVTNARALLAMAQRGEAFSAFIWSFVGGAPLAPPEGGWQALTHTSVSDALARALKQRGFTFVGTTICYAFMQACGMVNDHMPGCCLYHDASPVSASGQAR
ncbi:DNA-3-methyladenine glycosylase I [Edwardsiella piscicida]|uniref:DNA-3-methyladenine glycosylase n=3 Tax=Edwardsiella TaxID=635 RepID=A0A0H3DLM0_EDWTF|nr:DNA-3-methyladenine glycosylase I [Edwardsiella piscicida]ACY82861.1 3-methyladenine DNA glycosylase [Edwardsiella tarda EIB202]ADM40137.1 DNA-3-methyladenine glycosylase [Edwardsiella tarda FL6-60]AGH72147.1 DNA-3-methyladenine glycosylase [Edwardsiella piscicida C07-087]ARD18263.1 DNA-3-methyladenine glycosidase [Edwardsiella piscicida]EKS7781063.1 DNA-3-methyladenine glycosylase I [Edwardsiella piscicida]